MQQAVDSFKDQKVWDGLMLRGMGQDYSWAKATSEYEKLYKHALAKVKNTNVT